MKYELNGISTPFGGVSWNKTNSVKDKFYFLLFYLESKTSLDKGTQRKTTENELPSLTQCTA